MPRTCTSGGWLWADPLYRASFVLLVCPQGDVPRTLKRLRLRDEIEASLLREFATVPARGGAYTVTTELAAIWLSPTADIGLIAHEAGHAVFQLLRRRELLLTAESEEAYCYYLGWVTAEIEKRIRPRRRQ